MKNDSKISKSAPVVTITTSEKKTYSRSTSVIHSNPKKKSKRDIPMSRKDEISFSNNIHDEPSVYSINHFDLDNNNERSFLIPAQKSSDQPESWWNKFTNGAINLIKVITQSFRYVLSNPKASLAAFVTAGPTAINALAAPSHKSPQYLGKAWWNEMPDGKKIESILNGSSSLLINSILNILFLPKAWDKLKAAYRLMSTSPREAADTVLSVPIASLGVIPLATIAYKAFLWLPFGKYVSLLPALINYVVNWASRFIGSRDFFKRAHNIINEDAKAQKDLYEKLDHITQEDHLNTINDLLEEAKQELFIEQELDEPITQEDFQRLAAHFIESLGNLKGDLNSMTSSSCLDYTKWAGLCFDLAWASIASGAAYLIFMYEGYSGFKIGCDLCLGIDLDDPNVLSDWSRRSIGLVPGIASALFYFIYNLDLRDTLIDLLKQLRRYPTLLPAVLIVLGANYCASSSMENVTNSMTAHDNITGINSTTTPQAASTLALLMRLAGGGINLKGSVEKAFLSPPKVKDFDFSDFKRMLKKIHEHPLDHETATVLNAKFFNRTASQRGLQRTDSFISSVLPNPI